MANVIEYALMAGASYISSRAPLHRFPAPAGWSPTKYENPPGGSGFEAISFINGSSIATSTQIVISYAGTDPADIGILRNASLDPITDKSLMLFFLGATSTCCKRYRISRKASI